MADSKKDTKDTKYTIAENSGKGIVQIADDVVSSIVGLAVTEVDGVARLTGDITRELVAKLGKKNLAKGIYVAYDDAEDGSKKVKVNMGAAELIAKKVPVLSPNKIAMYEPIEVDGGSYHYTAVSMGNPHIVLYVDDPYAIDLEAVGPSFENHSYFPERTNTEFVRVLDRNHVEMRVWERGAGETWACGTGACAVAVSSAMNGLTGREVTVKLRGGDLEINWDEKTDHVFMTGPAVTVFEGEIDLR